MQTTALSSCSSQCMHNDKAQRRAACSSRLCPRPAACRPAAAQRQLGAQPAAAGSSSGLGGSQRGRGCLVVTAAIKVSKGKQVLCNKTLKAKEGHEDTVEQLCKEIAAFSKQRMADRSSGILAYEASQDDFEKGTFHFMELYNAHQRMTDHNNSDEVQQFVDKLVPHLDGPLGMVLYEYTNGKIGPACMEGEVKGEGGLDDAMGTNRFGGGASMKQTSNMVDLTSIKEKDDEEKGLWGIKGFNIKLPTWGKKKEETKK